MESGVGGIYAGVFDIQAKNVRNENGRTAVMMNPHTTHNGTVKIDSVWSKSSSACLLIHKGLSIESIRMILMQLLVHMLMIRK